MAEHGQVNPAQSAATCPSEQSMHEHRHEGKHEHQADRHRQQIKWVAPLPMQIDIERHMRTKEVSGNVLLDWLGRPWRGRPLSARTAEPLALPRKCVIMG